MIVAVEVGVALSRPPREDRISKVIISVDCATSAAIWQAEIEARLAATQMAAGWPGVVMAVRSDILEILEL